MHFEKLVTALATCVLCSALAAKSYYELICVKRDASSKESKKAFHKMALKYHPDKNKDDPDSEAKFVEIAKAYEVLSDENKRRDYDRYGESAFTPGGGGGSGGSGYQHEDFDFKEFFRGFDSHFSDYQNTHNRAHHNAHRNAHRNAHNKAHAHAHSGFHFCFDDLFDDMGSDEDIFVFNLNNDNHDSFLHDGMHFDFGGGAQDAFGGDVNTQHQYSKAFNGGSGHVKFSSHSSHTSSSRGQRCTTKTIQTENMIRTETVCN